MIVGIGSSGDASVPAFGARGEINTLYVESALARRSIGRRLMAALAVDLRERGYDGAALGVVAENAAAIAFYERLGGACLGRYTDPGPHWRSENLIYAWDDLGRLIAAGANPDT
jgi:ribosomal protein S18 acetylase RimI-like enzyme